MGIEVSSLRKSFKHALRGLVYAIINERNFQIELIIAVAMVFLAFIFRLRDWEFVVVILMIMWVLIMELTNTVVERVVDILKPRIHPYARLIKDIMAAVVLISSTSAAIVGVIIFWSYVRDLFCGIY